MGRRLPLESILRLLAIFAESVLLAACSEVNSDYANVGGVIYKAIAGSNVPLSQAAAIPYASLGVNVGSSPQGIFVLATQTSGDDMWLAGKEAAIVTRNGRLVQTSGFPQNLIAVRTGPEGADQVSRIYFYDLGEPPAYNVVVRCMENDKGIEQIEILGANLSTHHIVEHCVADMYGWNFDNEYWRDASTGFDWRSIQYFHPDQSPLYIDVFRPATDP